MTKYDKDTKFYWLLLKEDFFDDDAINWLEEQENGKEYAYFYIKLCVKSLKTNGILIRNVGEMLLPYDNKKLAEITNFDFDTVVVAMELLKNIGLVKVLENGEIYLTQVENMIGSKSLGAFKKQQQRTLRKQGQIGVGGQMSENCPPNIELELELENRDIVIFSKNIFDFLEENFNRTLSPIEYEEVSNWEDNELTRYVIKQTVLKGITNLKYIQTVLNSFKQNNIVTVQQAVSFEQKFKNKNNYSKNNFNNKELPSWFDSKIDENLATEEEIQEFESRLRK